MTLQASAERYVPVSAKSATPRGAWGALAALGLGYIGVYLCRKNLSVAVPLLQTAFGASKEQVGRVSSVGTFAYAIGKFTNGLIVDLIGGRRGYLLSLGAVSIFRGCGALVARTPGLFLLYAFMR